MPSQSDVAKLANVSFMTVSRVINGKENVKEETRQKVLKAIEELGYYPNAAARALNNNKTDGIGIVIPHAEFMNVAPYFLDLISSLERNIDKMGYHLVFKLPSSFKSASDYSQLYKERKVDGVIVLAPSVDQWLMKKLITDNVPSVVVYSRDEELDINYIDADNLKGAKEAVNYLISLGHKRIGMVTGSTTLICGRDRIDGYTEALKDNKIDVDKRLVYYGNWHPESGVRAFNYFFGLKDPPTAIFCANDHMALGIMRQAGLNKLKIPRDLSIFGYNDITYSGYLTPPLSTMKQPLEEIGEKAVDILIKTIENPDRPKEKIMLDTKFIKRDSCSFPRENIHIKLRPEDPLEQPELRIGVVYPHPDLNPKPDH
ncbi:MAG: LacI family DNA-binding transcriptional regulator [Spirochaetales bacterium]|uniref:LacI family DNA-binding transcriptional regulator n=1 Tax=Candidatus Thalassospirochaeta sargassi TaxID=3119039 RepID=A0AAJ1IDG3_9SPIO|nr:LacI family DNA-binding transcriptional regulator [Spirochaetales bacterium]